MSTYTKYHKAYEMRNKEKIKIRKKKRHCFVTYGIPIDEYDQLIDELKENRKHYKKLRDLHPQIIKYIMQKFHEDQN